MCLSPAAVEAASLPQINRIKGGACDCFLMLSGKIMCASDHSWIGFTVTQCCTAHGALELVAKTLCTRGLATAPGGTLLGTKIDTPRPGSLLACKINLSSTSVALQTFCFEKLVHTVYSKHSVMSARCAGPLQLSSVGDTVT